MFCRRCLFVQLSVYMGFNIYMRTRVMKNDFSYIYFFCTYAHKRWITWLSISVTLLKHYDEFAYRTRSSFLNQVLRSALNKDIIDLQTLMNATTVHHHVIMLLQRAWILQEAIAVHVKWDIGLQTVPWDAMVTKFVTLYNIYLNIINS